MVIRLTLSGLYVLLCLYQSDDPNLYLLINIKHSDHKILPLKK